MMFQMLIILAYCAPQIFLYKKWDLEFLEIFGVFGCCLDFIKSPNIGILRFLEFVVFLGGGGQP